MTQRQYKGNKQKTVMNIIDINPTISIIIINIISFHQLKDRDRQGEALFKYKNHTDSK